MRAAQTAHRITGAPPGCTSDAECDDGVRCNGAEFCEAGICMLGDEPCRGGVCDEEAMACNEPCPDAAGDGAKEASCGGQDCDDDAAARFPGNVEVCDPTDHDEDCDPTTFGFRDAATTDAATEDAATTDAGSDAGPLPCLTPPLPDGGF